MRVTASEGGAATEASVALIVEDDREVARSVVRRVPESLQTVVVASVAEALGAMAMPVALAGAVVDIGLPDGSGLKVVEGLRARHPGLPVMVLTATLDRELINAVHALGAEYVCKPDFDENLQSFLQRIDPNQQGDRRFVTAVEEAGGRFRLTRREMRILLEALDGVPRNRLAEVLGVSENTVKTQIRSLLDKMSQTSLSDAVWLVRNL
ncbi:MAG: response regulator [Myxococcota bacterium]